MASSVISESMKMHMYDIIYAGSVDTCKRMGAQLHQLARAGRRQLSASSRQMQSVFRISDSNTCMPPRWSVICSAMD